MTESTLGDPALTSRDVEPLSTARRTLSSARSTLLWFALGLSPLAYAAGLRDPKMGFGARVVALALSVILAGALALAMSRTARRYALGGFGPLRAAFGTRASAAAFAARWLVGVLWIAAWALELSVWTRRLLSAALPQSQDVQVWLQWHLPEPVGLAVATWLLLALAVLIGGWFARGRMRRLRWAAPTLAVAAAMALLGVVVVVGFERGSFDVELWRDVRWPWDAMGILALQQTILWWPLVIAAPEWVRYEEAAVRGTVAVVGMLPGALVMAWCGALLASAAPIIVTRADMALIPDATAAGGLWIGAVATVAGWLAFFAAGSLVGLHSPALALCGVSPKHLPYARALRTTVLAVIAAAPLVAWLQSGQLVGPAVTFVLAPLVGVWLADEWVVRRGRVVVEALYAHGRLRWSGIVALVLGWCVQVPLWSRLQSLWPSLEPVALDWACGVLVAACVHSFLAPCEVWLKRPRPAKPKAPPKRLKKRRRTDSPRFLGADDSQVDQQTNPHFNYKGDDKS